MVELREPQESPAMMPKANAWQLQFPAQEKAGELGEKFMGDGQAARTIAGDDRDIEHLGISEEGLIELVLQMNAQDHSALKA
jgi:hypothetical protein